MPAKWAVLNWDMGITEGWNSRDEAMTNCGENCMNTGYCQNLYENLQVDYRGQCDRNSFYGYINVTKSFGLVNTEDHTRSQLNSVKDSSMVI